MIFIIGGNAYSLVQENKSGWNPEAFRERYSEVLERYDYIVGDWGYNQLRLRGFYRDGHPRAGKDGFISSLTDYVNEYCNFGCAYFVVAKLDSKALPPEELAAAEEASKAKEPEEEEDAVDPATFSVNGMIVRWPLKERAGGPSRPPNITLSAIARAAEQSERRQASASADAAGGASGAGGKGGAAGNRGRDRDRGSDQWQRQGRPVADGGERRQAQGGSHSAKGHAAQRQQGRPQADGAGRPPLADAAERKPAEQRERPGGADGASAGDGARAGGSRWSSSKHRKRRSFGSKPKPDDGGTPGDS